MITGWSFIIVVAYSLEGGVRISWSLARFSIFPQIVTVLHPHGLPK